MALIEVDWRPPRRALRQFAALFLVVFATLGTVLYFRDRPLWVSELMWGLAAVVGVVGLIAPPLVRPVYVVMMAAALPIGMVVSTVLMLVIYYLILTPLGFAMRAFGYDPMGRKPGDRGKSFWVERQTAVDPKQYFKQY